MTNKEQQIINSIININVNKVFKINSSEVTTFILVDEEIKFSNDKSTNWQSFSELKASNNFILDDNTLKVSNEILDHISYSSESGLSDKVKTKKLLKVIDFYFKENGTNLHLVWYKEDLKLNENFNYTVGISLLTKNNEQDDKINAIISNSAPNSDNIFWIIANKQESELEGSRTFFLECGENSEYLAHPAAYLNRLNLNESVRDYNYSTAQALPAPSFFKEISANKGKWDGNHIISISGKAVFLGGELANGDNLVSEYALMLLNNALKFDLFNLLLTKPTKEKITPLVRAVIESRLNVFYEVGAIAPKVFKGSAINFVYNGKTYSILNTNEIIEKGYRLHIIDILDVSEEDEAAHTMTPINIILSFEKQVRFIKLNMEIN